MANIVCTSRKVVKVEIEKKCYWKCCLWLSNRHRQQIKLYPTRCHNPLITYPIHDCRAMLRSVHVRWAFFSGWFLDDFWMIFNCFFSYLNFALADLFSLLLNFTMGKIYWFNSTHNVDQNYFWFEQNK